MPRKRKQLGKEKEQEEQKQEPKKAPRAHVVASASGKQAYGEAVEWVEKLALSTDADENVFFFSNTAALSRHFRTAAELSDHLILGADQRKLRPSIVLPSGLLIRCYQCGTEVNKVHGFYVRCCRRCGQKNWSALQYQHTAKARAFADATNCIAIVIGGRTKIGYQVALRLLRAGAQVYVTTRFPERAWELFRQETDVALWEARLAVLPLDLNKSAREVMFDLEQMKEALMSEGGVTHIDVLVNVAAQTIRGIERHRPSASTSASASASTLLGQQPVEEDKEAHAQQSPKQPAAIVEANRYGDARHFPADMPNSWQLRLGDVDPAEIEEVLRVNAAGPFLVFEAFLPLLLRSTHPRRMVINTHAREGLFNVPHKSSLHPHTNMAKAALHQLTQMINVTRFDSPNNAPKQKIACHGICPGWVSVDEYSQALSPFQSAPLTELDGASRLLDPFFSRRTRPSSQYTIRHFGQLVM